MKYGSGMVVRSRSLAAVRCTAAWLLSTRETAALLFLPPEVHRAGIVEELDFHPRAVGDHQPKFTGKAEGMRRLGIEPRTYGLKVRCSTN
jgi:hypothetical protein